MVDNNPQQCYRYKFDKHNGNLPLQNTQAVDWCKNQAQSVVPFFRPLRCPG